MTIQIKVIVKDGFKHNNIFYSFGDISTEPKELGEYFIKAGWAEDTSGQIPSSQPFLSEVILAPDNFSQRSFNIGIE